LFIIKVLNKKIVFTIHDPVRLLRINNNIFYKFLFNSDSTKYIGVNALIIKQFERFKIANKKIFLIPAYIKDVTTSTTIINKNRFVEKSNFPILSIYAVGFVHHNFEDLYGIDLAIDAVHSLKENYPHVYLQIIIPDSSKTEIFNDYKKNISSRGMDDNIVWFTETLDSMSPIYNNTDVFLRPTNTDGDSVCVREALDAKCVVVASDIADRPNGVICFRNRDLNDMVLKIKYAIENKSGIVDNLNSSNDFYCKLIEVYNSYK
jgi:glycosyltransferase involved in cell wall biosynthesis